MSDLSLHGLRDLAETKKGIPKTANEYRDLRDLDTLITKMVAIRSNQSTEGCSSHGSQVSDGQVRTKCSGHSSTYTTGDWSLGKTKKAIGEMRTCTCDSHQEWFCRCQTNAPRS